jgi:hypothetical protein
LEKGVLPSELLARDIARANAAWHDTPTVKVGKCVPAMFGKMVKACL